MKIVSSGSTISSPEFHRKKQKKRRKQLIIGSSILTILLVGLVFFSRLESFRIKAVTVTGAQVVGEDSVQAVVEEIIAGHYLWVIPRNNAFIYPENNVRETIRERFERFSSVQVELAGLTGLSIVVEEREPTALYCADEPEQGIYAGCYFLDEKGLIFDAAPTFSDGVYFVYTSEAQFEDPLGQAFLPAQEFALLSEFVRKLQLMNVEPRVFAATAEYHITLASGAVITWLPETNLELVYSNLESFLQSEEIKTQTDFWERILVLDLRTANKVFYSFRE
jgi:hypothetical protein